MLSHEAIAEASLQDTRLNTTKLDEAHEMCINRAENKPMMHAEAAAIDTLTYYLPSQADLMRNFRSQILQSSDNVAKDTDTQATQSADTRTDDTGTTEHTQPKSAQAKERSENVQGIFTALETDDLFATDVGSRRDEVKAYITSSCIMTVLTSTPPGRQRNLRTRKAKMTYKVERKGPR